jgi:5'(3')-deoxyribonucleotidase
MRELLFKNITSGNKKRKDLYVSETSDENGITTTTQRHSTYIMGACNKFNSLEQLQEWKKTIGPNAGKKHIFIIKKRDTKLNKDMFICDVIGKFYAVTGCEIYSVVFKHSFEVDFLYTGTSKQGGAL